MANIYKAMAPFWVEVLILSPEDTAIFCLRFFDIQTDEISKVVFSSMEKER